MFGGIAHPGFRRVSERIEGWPDDIKDRPGWKVWSSRGNTSLWYHATDSNEPFAIFCKQDEGSIGFHAGTLNAALNRHQHIYRIIGPEAAGKQGFILPLIIRYTNALEIDDQYDWRLDKLTRIFLEMEILSEDEEDQILRQCNVQGIFGVLERAGYDAILYPNACEGIAYQGEAYEESILVWRAANIKSANAIAFEEESPLLCPSLFPSEWEVATWQQNEWEIDSWIEENPVIQTNKIKII